VARSLELLATNPRGFGWEALVALGTLLLALSTFYLALRTSTLAKASEAEVRAQWRPVILPGSDSSPERAIVYDDNEGSLHVRVRNAGRGPALYIRTHLEPWGREPSGVSPEHWSLGALAPGDERELRFRTPEIERPSQLLFDYRDLADRTYSTSVTIDVVNGDMRFYDVHLFEDHSVTYHGDAVYPQPGLRDVSPKALPGLRARLRRAVRSPRGTFEER
jgi:hypothetical protein